MSCSDCGKSTFIRGVCVDCVNKRALEYPKLKIIEKKYTLVSNLLRKNQNGVNDGDLDWIINVASDDEIKNLKGYM